MNINKSNIKTLIKEGTSITDGTNIGKITELNADEKYVIELESGSVKKYSFATLQKNWKVVSETSEETTEEVEETVEASIEETTEATEEKEEVPEEKKVTIDEYLAYASNVAENEYIFANELRYNENKNVSGYIYGVPVKNDKINQTTIWKVMNALYDNKDNDRDPISTEQKTFCVKQLKELDDSVFDNAVRCLVSKCKQNYILSLLEA